MIQVARVGEDVIGNEQYPEPQRKRHGVCEGYREIGMVKENMNNDVESHLECRFAL